MSSSIAFSLNITLDNKSTYLSGSGTIDMSYTTNLGLTAGSSKTGYVNVTPTGISSLFPNDAARPSRITVDYYHYALTANDNNYSLLTINGTQVVSTASSDYQAISYNNSGAIAAAMTKNSSIQWTLHTKSKSLFESTPWTALGGYEGIQINLYFTRYDFAAIAGDNISSASVSSSTGYDGDSVTYSCVLASGATFDGWYNGPTRVSTSQTYTLAVSGADTTLEARATASTTKTLSATYNGSQLSGFPVSVQADTAVSYNGSVIATVPFAGGTKTLNCANKIMTGNVTLCGKTLNCKDKVMASNVVVSISWEEA